jgi:hypothetical protein
MVVFGSCRQGRARGQLKNRTSAVFGSPADGGEAGKERSEARKVIAMLSVLSCCLVLFDEERYIGIHTKIQGYEKAYIYISISFNKTTRQTGISLL